jgi:hypothetical protein
MKSQGHAPTQGEQSTGDQWTTANLNFSGIGRRQFELFAQARL